MAQVIKFYKVGQELLFNDNIVDRNEVSNLIQDRDGKWYYTNSSQNEMGEFESLGVEVQNHLKELLRNIWGVEVK